MPPLVSIVITAYNKAQYLEQSVRSVLAQTYPDIECLIVDDGSTDNTAQVAEQLVGLDERIRYLPKPNGGVSSARNFGLEHAKGEWIQFLDADDWIPKDKIQAQLSHVQSLGLTDTEVVIYSDYERVFVNRQGHVLETRMCTVGELTQEKMIERLLICPDFLAATPFPLLQQTMLMKRSLLDRIRFDERLKACEDREFVINLISENIPFIYVPTLGAYYRKHASNLTDNEILMRESYIGYFNIVCDRHPHLRSYCQTSVTYLLDKTLEVKDGKNFDASSQLVEFPVLLLDGKIRINNLLFLKLVYLIRCLMPNFLLYKRYRGPRSKKVISILSRTFGRMQNSKA
jgi:glycosyltransferase involved in cell wall biosynthesis